MSSHVAKMQRNATAREEHMAMVSEMRNAWKAAFLAKRGCPASEESELNPPGNVKAAAKVIVARRTATKDVLEVYFVVSDLTSSNACFLIVCFALRLISCFHPEGIAFDNNVKDSFCDSKKENYIYIYIYIYMRDLS